MKIFKNVIFLLTTLSFMAVDVVIALISDVRSQIEDALTNWPLSAKLVSTLVLIIVLLWSFPYYMFKRGNKK